MVGNILKCVNKTEGEADEIVQKAQKDAQEMLQAAEQKAEQMKKQTVDTIKFKNQEMLKEMQSLESRALEDAAVAAQKEGDALRRRVQERKAKAVEAVVSMMSK